MDSKVIMGTISLLADNTNYLEKRVEMHKKQVYFINHINEVMVDKGASPLPWYRVEQGWSKEREEYLASPYAISLKSDPIPAGAARNKILEIFYKTDADWLVCMDDDMGLYDHYDGYELLWNLGSPQFINLAKKGFLITPFPAYWDGYKALVEKWGKADTHWLLTTTRHTAAPFLCIPNCRKYFNVEVMYDDKSACANPGDVPEDLKFWIDWLHKTKGRWVECMNMIGKSMGDLDCSSIFNDPEARAERYKSDEKWSYEYLKHLYPRNPALWKKSEFFKRKNPALKMEVLRDAYTKD